MGEGLRILVSNVLTVENPSKEILDWCRKNLVFTNPEYAKKARMGFWLRDTPKTVSLYEIRGDTLVLPFGVLKSLPKEITDTSTFVSEFAPVQKVEYNAEVSLYDYQEKAVQEMLNAKYGILQSPAGSGKGLLLSAKIYTPDGFTRMGDLKIGDVVCNTYGGQSVVTNIFDRGKQFCYKVTFTDDTAIICDKDHLWTVKNTRKYKAKWETLSTEDLYKNGIVMNNNLMYEIPIVKPVMFDSKKVTIEPWLLGALLGDGCFVNSSIGFSNTEEDIIQNVKNCLDGELVHKSKADYYIADGGRIKCRLMDYELLGRKSCEKFIPNDYKFNSIDIRLNVLRGLIDTDGSVSGTSISISSTSKRLIDDCLWIVQSLGGTGKIAERQTFFTYKGEKKKGEISYRLYLKLYNFEPFTSEKHKKSFVPRTKYIKAYRRMKSIEITAPQVTRCIEVNSIDNLFITDSFIATHNTQMGIALATRLGKKTLWLCHTLDLIRQSKERAEQYIDKSLLGAIVSGKVNIGKGITFATVQTMSKLDLQAYKNEWDCIITDEVHRVAGSPTAVTQYMKVLNNLSARHKYGLSATVHRSDGMIEATFALVGEVAYRVPDEAVSGRIMNVGILPVGTGIQLDREALNTDGTLNYSKLITYLTKNEERQQVIIDALLENEGHSCLILSDRLEHLEDLISRLPTVTQMDAVMVSGKMTSKKGKAEREKAIEDMRTGEKKYLFATYSLCKEGLDIPRLDRLFLTTPQKDFAVVTQSIGRIARTFEGKEPPIAYDFVDDIGYLVKSYKKRCSTYRKNRCYFVEGK